MVLSQGLLGIKPEIDGLKIEPCLSKEFKQVQVTRIFRDAKYNIHILNDGSKEKGLYVDGHLIEGNIIPFNKDKKVYEVELSI